jgi:hypothetical protein
MQTDKAGAERKTRTLSIRKLNVNIPVFRNQDDRI